LRQTWKLVTAFAACIILAITVQYTVAFIRTPGVVARVEQSGNFPLELSAFHGQRLNWLLKVQDPDFYQHHGVDLGTPGAGYTTITQGLVKILFFDDFQPGFSRWRKIQQTIMAVAFNARVSKDQQLRLFVNLAHMGMHNGREITGFSPAAQEYFGKDFQNLTDQEYLALIAVLVAPAKYSPATHPGENENRVARIRRVIAGTCKARSHSDVFYNGCAQSLEK
jgi:membrane carboxypeptidase/penicillin-binding protein